MEIDQIKLQQYITKNPKQGARVLSQLGKNHQFVNAISDPVGQDIMRDAINQMEGLLEKIVNEESTDAERAEYRAYRRILDRWTERINRYKTMVDEVNSTT